jgi:hypothetical protein
VRFLSQSPRFKVTTTGAAEPARVG